MPQPSGAFEESKQTWEVRKTRGHLKRVGFECIKREGAFISGARFQRSRASGTKGLRHGDQKRKERS
jgi:hypothetical protein